MMINKAKNDPILKILFLLFWGFLLFSHEVVSAGVQIRVSILQDVEIVKISAPAGLKIKAKGLERISQPISSVEIANRSGTLIVNNKVISEDTIRIMSFEGDVLAVNDKRFKGTIEVKRKNERLLVINEIDLEEYLKGVVPVEVSPKWSMEALKAQAIVSRTYALYQRRANIDRDYHLVSTIMDQAYNGRDAEDIRASKAVSVTEGLVLTYDGDLILAVFHSTSSGATEDGANLWSIDVPYLRGVECPFDQDSPFYQWKKNIGFAEIESAIKGGGYKIGAIANITTYAWSRSGRVMGLRIIHSGGELLLRGEELRRLIGYSRIPSANFEIDEIGREIRIEGKGAGHGVGLCQWGAKEMAEIGFRYQDILRYYFSGTEIVSYSSVKQ